MQKLLRRTAQAQAQASRRSRAQASKARAETRRIRHSKTTDFNRKVLDDAKAAKLARREDYLLGPLAPRRDVGAAKETYGMLDARRLAPPATQGIGLEKRRKEAEWCGIRQGDRVVVIGKRERDYGNIGEVVDVRWRHGDCIVEGVNLVDVKTPNALRTSDQKAYRTQPSPIPISSVRLIYPLPPAADPTAPPIDTLIPALTRLPNRPGRYIHPASDPPIRIPWPRKEKVGYQDHDIDTLRIDAEQESWIPTLIRAPMPGGVIDELRNKYSKFRTRHEDSYLKRFAKVDAREGRREVRRQLGWKEGMMTPVKELLVKKRVERMERQEEGISEEVLGRIGEAIARRRGLEAPMKEVRVEA